MARRKPFEQYRSTTKAERVIERRKLIKMQTTKRYQKWLEWALRMQLNECYYCDTPIDLKVRSSYHIEHRVPIYWGGKNDYPNLCLACPDCNRTKSTDQLIRNKKYLNDMNAGKRHKVIYL